MGGPAVWAGARNAVVLGGCTSCTSRGNLSSAGFCGGLRGYWGWPGEHELVLSSAVKSGGKLVFSVVFRVCVEWFCVLVAVGGGGGAELAVQRE